MGSCPCRVTAARPGAAQSPPHAENPEILAEISRFAPKYLGEHALFLKNPQKSVRGRGVFKINFYFSPDLTEMTKTYSWNGFYYYFFYEGRQGPL